MSGTLASFAILLALGAHGVVPSGLASDPTGAGDPAARILRARRRWALGALPLLLAAVTIFLGWLRWHPDPLIALGWGSEPLTTFSAQAAAAMVLMLAGADLLVLVAFRRLEPGAWRLLSWLAFPALAATSLFLEILRVGQGPRTTLGALVLTTLSHAAVALGTGAALGIHTGDRPLSPLRPVLVWPLPAGLLLPLYPLALPSEVRDLLLAEGAGLTLGAASLLFLTTPWLPARLRRPALLAAGVLSALVLAQTRDLASTFPEVLPPLPAL